MHACAVTDPLQRAIGHGWTIIPLEYALCRRRTSARASRSSCKNKAQSIAARDLKQRVLPNRRRVREAAAAGSTFTRQQGVDPSHGVRSTRDSRLCVRVCAARCKVDHSLQGERGEGLLLACRCVLLSGEAYVRRKSLLPESSGGEMRAASLQRALYRGRSSSRVQCRTHSTEQYSTCTRYMYVYLGYIQDGPPYVGDCMSAADPIPPSGFKSREFPAFDRTSGEQRDVIGWISHRAMLYPILDISRN